MPDQQQVAYLKSVPRERDKKHLDRQAYLGKFFREQPGGGYDLDLVQSWIIEFNKNKKLAKAHEEVYAQLQVVAKAYSPYPGVLSAAAVESAVQLLSANKYLNKKLSKKSFFTRDVVRLEDLEKQGSILKSIEQLDLYSENGDHSVFLYLDGKISECEKSSTKKSLEIIQNVLRERRRVLALSNFDVHDVGFLIKLVDSFAGQYDLLRDELISKIKKHSADGSHRQVSFERSEVDSLQRFLQSICSRVPEENEYMYSRTQGLFDKIEEATEFRKEGRFASDEKLKALLPFKGKKLKKLKACSKDILRSYLVQSAYAAGVGSPKYERLSYLMQTKILQDDLQFEEHKKRSKLASFLWSLSTQEVDNLKFLFRSDSNKDKKIKAAIASAERINTRRKIDSKITGGKFGVFLDEGDYWGDRISHVLKIIYGIFELHDAERRDVTFDEAFSKATAFIFNKVFLPLLNKVKGVDIKPIKVENLLTISGFIGFVGDFIGVFDNFNTALQKSLKIYSVARRGEGAHNNLDSTSFYFHSVMKASLSYALTFLSVNSFLSVFVATITVAASVSPLLLTVLMVSASLKTIQKRRNLIKKDEVRVERIKALSALSLRAKSLESLESPNPHDLQELRNLRAVNGSIDLLEYALNLNPGDLNSRSAELAHEVKLFEDRKQHLEEKLLGKLVSTVFFAIFLGLNVTGAGLVANLVVVGVWLGYKLFDRFGPDWKEGVINFKNSIVGLLRNVPGIGKILYPESLAPGKTYFKAWLRQAVPGFLQKWLGGEKTLKIGYFGEEQGGFSHDGEGSNNSSRSAIDAIHNVLYSGGYRMRPTQDSSDEDDLKNAVKNLKDVDFLKISWKENVPSKGEETIKTLFWARGERERELEEREERMGQQAQQANNRFF